MDGHLSIPLVFNLISTAALAALGWAAREVWHAVRELERREAELRASLPSTYVSKDDFKAFADEVKALLGKIFDLLNAKADK